MCQSVGQNANEVEVGGAVLSVSENALFLFVSLVSENVYSAADSKNSTT